LTVEDIAEKYLTIKQERVVGEFFENYRNRELKAQKERTKAIAVKKEGK
jgi:hypothetical protein